jgi:hypothetical protein
MQNKTEITMGTKQVKTNHGKMDASTFSLVEWSL